MRIAGGPGNLSHDAAPINRGHCAAQMPQPPKSWEQHHLSSLAPQKPVATALLEGSEPGPLPGWGLVQIPVQAPEDDPPEAVETVMFHDLLLGSVFRRRGSPHFQALS